MAIPQGYRLLTAEDVGKVFGVDLELGVYIDTEISLTNSSSIFTYNKTNNLTNFIQSSYLYNPGYEANVAKIECTQTDNYILWEESVGGWYVAYGNIITMFESTEITSFNTEIENWNTWFYVKDKFNPYNIKIKNKEGIKLITKDKTIEFTDDVKITIDESLLGGGGSEETGYTLTLNQYSNETKYKYYPFGDTSGGFQYRINGGEWQTFANAPITIKNVRTIQFFAHATAEYGCSLVIKENNNVNAIYDTEIYCKYDYTDEPNNAQSFCMCLIEDTTLYVGGTRDSMSGGGAN